ncbi:MAG: hypothetical protein P1V51_20820 [Deltaproteobacteria bacterium]|nr:hypothetical protein [Deltaproteobacteria bacterium]
MPIVTSAVSSSAPLTGAAPRLPAAPATDGPPGERFRVHLERAGGIPAPPVEPGPVAPGGSAPLAAVGDAGATESVSRLYRGAREGSRALDALISEARAGRTFTSQELIGLQARIYRSTLILETFSKVVESTSSGARQLLGTQL